MNNCLYILTKIHLFIPKLIKNSLHNSREIVKTMKIYSIQNNIFNSWNANVSVIINCLLFHILSAITIVITLLAIK